MGVVLISATKLDVDLLQEVPLLSSTVKTTLKTPLFV